MRRLAYLDSAEERDRITLLLESRGIPTFYQSAIRSLLGRDATRGALFVCINAQYDDAVALLSNEHHEVRDPVDVEAFKSAVNTTSPALVKAVLLVLVVVVAAWLLVVLLVPHR
ncbi:MAG TPA: hypothetical protein VKB52_07295 [Rhodanobacteraceae bacterium]|nr:hypothetical protein [Rhodanobacteraceae bacterium]